MTCVNDSLGEDGSKLAQAVLQLISGNLGIVLSEASHSAVHRLGVLNQDHGRSYLRRLVV